MTATVILEVLCLAGVVFMIRFLVALFTDGKRNSRHHVVYQPSWPSRRDNGLLHLTSESGTMSAGSDTRSQLGFQVISGGANRPARRVG